MGCLCCLDRDKPVSTTSPSIFPPHSPLSQRPKPSSKVVLLIAHDPALFPLLLTMLQTQYSLETHEKGVYFSAENCQFDLRTVASSDVRKVVSDANEAKVVMFFFDLQDRKALIRAKDTANAFKAAIRMDAQRYLVGYNACEKGDETQKAVEAAGLLGFLYVEIPFPKPSNRQLVQSMQK